ncbi:MAG: hypothetical protein ACRYG8_05550 [Janthinobacterium lividum]
MPVLVRVSVKALAALAEEQVARAAAKGTLLGVREALAEAQRRADLAEQGIGGKPNGLKREFRWLGIGKR